jgi:hypothetical protein
MGKCSWSFVYFRPMRCVQARNGEDAVADVALSRRVCEREAPTLPRPLGVSGITPEDGSARRTIMVQTKDVMLAPDERSLSVMRWIQQSIPPSDRWFPVIRRYVNQIAARVSALGGNPTTIVPSPTGGVATSPPSGGQPAHSEPLEFTDKVNGLKYNHFGDFEGFFLRTEHGRDEWFESREHEIEILARRAWGERILISVITAQHAPHEVQAVVFRESSGLFRH